MSVATVTTDTINPEHLLEGSIANGSQAVPR